MNPRPSAPITAKEVLGWFEAAKVKGATLEGVAPFALALEQRRRHRGEHEADGALQDAKLRLDEIRKAAGRLARLIAEAEGAPVYGPVLARAPEVADLATALVKFNASVPAPPRNRPPDEMVLTGKRMREVLDRVIPADAAETARRRILRDALLRLGFKGKSALFLDDMAGLIRRRQRIQKSKAQTPKN
jgi:hypothetical protein